MNVTCVRCAKIAQGFKYTDRGWLCERCAKDAVSILAFYVMPDGQVYNAFLPVLNPTASVWVNLGDTYWSGRGQHRSDERKQSARRFGLRPQDRRGRGLWTRAKQLLLIPHRFAIAMQASAWIVRNDNVWVRVNREELN